MEKTIEEERPHSLIRLAVVTSAATFLLLIAGSVVTTTSSGDSIPDWPLSQNKLIPKFEGGVVYEYSHRVFAGLVLIFTIILTIKIWRRKNILLRKLSLMAILLVFTQALIGGVRVLHYKLKISPEVMAIIHAGIANLFFSLLICITFFILTKGIKENEIIKSRRLKIISILTFILIYVQLIMGALVRHYKATLIFPDFPTSNGKIIPPLDNLEMTINFFHRLGAFIVVFLVVLLFLSSLKEKRVISYVYLLMLCVFVQFIFGAFITWSQGHNVIRTIHSVSGSLLFAFSALVNARVFSGHLANL